MAVKDGSTPKLMFPRGRMMVLLSLILCFVSYTVVFAKPPVFATSGLHHVDVGLEGVDGTIAAFGDFNADKATDMFLLNTEQTMVTVRVWNHDKFRFEKLPDTELAFDATNPSKYSIVNLIPGDFNNDGKLDILLMAQEKTNTDVTHMRIFFGDAVRAFDKAKFLDLPPATVIQPFVLDFTGKMTPNLMGYPASDSARLSLWKPSEGSILSNISLSDSASGKQACRFSHPHSNAFIDLDGDCLADLFFTCQEKPSDPITAQIWINKKAEGFALAREFSLPEGSGQVTFADVDGDGTLDMIFPTCDRGNNCAINVAYNKQIPLCGPKLSTNCRDIHDLCVADPGFQFEFSESSGNFVRMPLRDVLASEETIMMQNQFFTGTFPVPLRIGDFNNDGYPDLLTVAFADGDQRNSRIRLLRSVPCTSPPCSDAAVAAKRRMFRRETGGVDDLDKIFGMSVGAAFMDLDENGSLDVIVFGIGDIEGKSVYKTTAFLNNFFNDAFFLKSLVLNGVCHSWCPTGERFPSPKPYGVNFPGASFKFTVIDTLGQRRANQVAQLSQSSYMSLQTPYSLSGLGRTNNYIEDFFVGVTRHQEDSVISYQGVIPNSQLIIIPYQPEGVQDSSTWKLELYINPSRYAGWVLLVLCTSLALLGIITYVLHWFEKREDEIEKRKALHIINFDAL